MAKIKHAEIIESGNPFTDTTAGLEQLLGLINQMKAQFGELKKEIPATFKGSEDIKKLVAAKQKAAETTVKMTAAEREAQKAAASLQKQRDRGLAAMGKEEAKQRELIAAANSEGKSIEGLQKRVSALITLRKQLDLTTDSGRQKNQQYTAAIKQGTDQLKAYDREIGVHNRNVGNYQSALDGLRGGFVALGAAITGVIMVTRRLNRIREQAMSMYDEQAKSERSLLVALKGREDIQQRLIKQAQDLQRVTLFGDEKTIAAARSLATVLGANEEAISAILPLAQDMATAMDMDLDSAAKLLARTLGSSTNALARYGIEVEGAVGSTERLESMTGNLARMFGGQAAEAAKVGTGSIQQMKNSMDDAREVMGKLFTEMSSGYVQSLSKLVNWFNDLDYGVQKNIMQWGMLGVAVIALRVSLGLMLTRVLPGLIAGFRGLITVVRTSTLTMATFTKAMNANVIMAGLTVLLTAFVGIRQAVAGASEELEGFSDIINANTARVAEQTAGLKDLVSQIKASHPESKERNKLLAEFNRLTGSSIENTKDHIALFTQLDKTFKEVQASMREEMEATVKHEKYMLALRRQQELEHQMAVAGIRSEQLRASARQRGRSTREERREMRSLRGEQRKNREELAAANIVLEASAGLYEDYIKKIDDAEDAITKFTQAQIDLMQAYMESTGEIVPMTDALLRLAEAHQKGEKPAKDTRNELEKLRDEVSKLETAMSLAIMKGEPFADFLNQLTPKYEQLSRVERLVQLMQMLAKGEDVFGLKLEDTKIDIEFDFGDFEEETKAEAEAVLKMMEEMSGKTAKRMAPLSLQEMLGLSDQDVDQIKTAIQTITAEFNKMFDERKRLADEALSQARANTDQTIQLLQVELEKRNQGLANNTSAMEQQLKAQMKLQEEAEERQRRASIAIIRMKQLETGAQMIQAGANLFANETATKGVLGIITAAAGLAAMLALFAGYQSQVSALKAESGVRYTEGKRGAVTGDRHSAKSGGEMLSSHVQAEAGENVYVLSRSHSKGDGGALMDNVFDSINAGKGIFDGGFRMMTPVVNVANQMSEKGIGRLIEETRQTNKLLRRWKFYNPMTGAETDLQGNKKIYS